MSNKYTPVQRSTEYGVRSTGYIVLVARSSTRSPPGEQVSPDPVIGGARCQVLGTTLEYQVLVPVLFLTGTV